MGRRESSEELPDSDDDLEALTDEQLLRDPIELGDDDYPYLSVESGGQVLYHGKLLGVDRNVRDAFVRSLAFWELGYPNPFGASFAGATAVKEVQGELALELSIGGRRLLLYEGGATWRDTGTYLPESEIFQALRDWADEGVH